MPDVRLIHGDCLDILPTLEAGSVDAVITDPPYSSGTRREAPKGLRKSMTRGKDDDEWFTTDCLTTNGFVWMMRQTAARWKNALVAGGHVLVFIDWRMMPNLTAAIESANYRHVDVLVWNKTYFGMGAYFRNQHELILHFTNGRSLPVQRHDVGNVLSVKPIRNGDHPTEKPTELLETLASVVCPENGTILDPFMGSGTTGVACVNLGFNFIGIELDRGYFEVAQRRIAEAQLQPRLFEATHQDAPPPEQLQMEAANA